MAIRVKCRPGASISRTGGRIGESHGRSHSRGAGCKGVSSEVPSSSTSEIEDSRRGFTAKKEWVRRLFCAVTHPIAWGLVIAHHSKLWFASGTLRFQVTVSDKQPLESLSQNLFLCEA